MKKVTISFLVGDDINQNEFKNWVKSCPFSHEGGQNLTWENIPEAKPVAEEPAQE